MICHGQGDPRTPAWDGGCCWLPDIVDEFAPARVCPQRWEIDYTGAATTRDATILDSEQNVLGTVDSYVKSIHNGKPRQDRVVEVIEGRTFVCGALANAVIADGIPTGANWQDDFNAAWSAAYDPGGIAAEVGDVWAAYGFDRDRCVSYGLTPADGANHCCFREDQATNDARAANLSATSVTIASRTLGA